MYRVRQYSKLENAVTRKVLQQVQSIIEECYSKLGCLECYFDECETLVICIHGGLNGCGEWSKYFDDLSDLIENLLDYFEDAWVINIDNDCMDDVFYAYIGLRLEED